LNWSARLLWAFSVSVAVDENVTFSSTANLTDKAKSDRAEAFKVTP